MIHDNAEMLKRLEVGLQQLKIARDMQEDMTNELIGKLPDDKKTEAINLLIKAKKGTLDLSELKNFASNLDDTKKKEFDKAAEDAFERIKKKNEDLAKEATEEGEEEETDSNKNEDKPEEKSEE